MFKWWDKSISYDVECWSGNRKVGNWLVYDRTLIRCMEVIDNELATDKQYKVVVSPIADGPDIIRENGKWSSYK